MRPIESNDEFQRYLRGIMSRAHHSHIPYEVLYALVAEVQAARDTGTPMWARVNQIGVTISGEIYTFSFTQELHAITVRHGSQQGPIVAMFGPSSTVDQVREFIHNLRPADACRFHPATAASA